MNVPKEKAAKNGSSSDSSCESSVPIPGIGGEHTALRLRFYVRHKRVQEDTSPVSRCTRFKRSARPQLETLDRVLWGKCDPDSCS